MAQGKRSARGKKGLISEEIFFGGFFLPGLESVQNGARCGLMTVMMSLETAREEEVDLALARLPECVYE